MINNILKIIGIIAILIGIFLIGFVFGTMPTEQEEKLTKAQTQAARDLGEIADKSEVLYTLCENKYQTAINGDLPEAFRLNGQIDVLVNQIDAIKAKYETDAL